MTPALIMLVIPGLPSYNGVEVFYLKGVLGLPVVISFRDRWYIHIYFFENGLIDDVIVIDWTDSDFKISRALGPTIPSLWKSIDIYSNYCPDTKIQTTDGQIGRHMDTTWNHNTLPLLCSLGYKKQKQQKKNKQKQYSDRIEKENSIDPDKTSYESPLIWLYTVLQSSFVCRIERLTV